MGDKPLSMVAGRGAGECVRQVFNHPDDYTDKIIGLESDRMVMSEICDVMSKVLADETVQDGRVGLRGHWL